MDSLETIRDTVAAESAAEERVDSPPVDNSQAVSTSVSTREVKPVSRLSADDIHVTIDHSRSLE